jgi:hypothetical protein
VVSLVLLAVAVVALLGGRRSSITGYGLISALPWAYLVAVLAMVGVFFTCLLRTRSRPAHLYLQVAAVAVALALAPILLEPFARFATAYTHAGFVDYIQRTGQLLQGYDARFSWPGFFATGALFAEASGLRLDQLLRWTPLFLDLSYLLALAAIVWRITSDARRRALTLMLFALFNWVGQDYFAPQGVTFLLYLVFAAVFLTLYPAPRPDSRMANLVGRLLLRERHEGPDLPAEDRQWLTGRVRAGLLGALLVVFSAIVVSHQLTPVFALLTVVALTLLGFNRSWTLPVLLGVLFLSYFSWGATDYWSGHLDELLGGVGQLGDAVSQNVINRVDTSATTTAARDTVVYSRIGMTLAIWGLALVGLLRNRQRSLIGPAVLAAWPLLVLALQSYGGEAILRIQLFALPWLCILAANAIRLPRATGPRRRPPWARAVSLVTVCVLACATTAVFLLARYGNESFEEMRPSDVATVEALYAVAPDGAVIFSLNDQLPWKDRRIGQLSFGSLTPDLWNSRTATEAFGQMLYLASPAYLVVTESQWQQVRQLDGISEVDIQRIQRLIGTAPWLRQLYGDAESGVYVVEGAP